MDTSTVLRTLLNDQDRAELLGRDTAITQVEVAPDTSIVLGTTPVCPLHRKISPRLGI